MSDQILVLLESLAATYPWDTVSIWATREPKGDLSFTAYIRENGEMRFPSEFGHGKTAEAAVTSLIKAAGKRDPEKLRQEAIEKLKKQIDKLEAAEFGIPPYIPNREIADAKPIQIIDL